MAEEKKNEVMFSLYDNITNALICRGNVSIYIIKDSKKVVIANKKLTLFPIKLEIEEKYLKEKLYIELLDNPDYLPHPFPDPKLSTIPICFSRHSLVQTIRFIPKGTYIGIVKAYGKEMGILNSKEEVYLSNWKDETISISKAQTITLKAFLFSRVDDTGVISDTSRYFLNNDNLEDSHSKNIHWAFTISKNIFSYKTVSKRSELKTISATTTLNNTVDGEIGKFSDIKQIKEEYVYKLIQLGKEVTGHTICFNLSYICTESLLMNKAFLDKYYIMFFAYEFKEDDNLAINYNKTSDNLPLKQLKIASNKYSMVFDGYHLELYNNGNYIQSFKIEDSNLINLILNNQIKYNTGTKNNVNYMFKYSLHMQPIQNIYLINNMSLYQINLIPYEENNNFTYKNIVDIGASYDKNDEYNYAVGNQSCSKSEYERQKYFGNEKSTNYNSCSDIKDSNMLSIFLSAYSYKCLMTEIYQKTDILVKYIHKPQYIIEVTRYKEVYNSAIDSRYIKERYGATYGVFAIYVYYEGEKYLLDSIVKSMDNDKEKNIYDKIILDEIDKNNNPKKVEVESLNLTLVNNYISIQKNRNKVKNIMNTIDLQNKESYGDLKYGGYTMEPSGPDNITEGVKRRIPEGHYKGMFHGSNDHYKNNTMKIYSDLVRSGRAILIHAGKKSIIDTEGCILVSSKSYETDNKSLNVSLLKKELLHAFYKTLKQHYNDKEYKLHKYVNIVIRNNFGLFGE